MLQPRQRSLCFVPAPPTIAPAGLPVTEQGAHNYPHHKGVFLVLGKINNTNLYVDTTHHSGRLEARETTFRLDGQALVMDTAIDWLDETGQILIAERRVHRFYVGELDGLANRIDIDSRLTTPLAAGADLPKNKHAYFHCRVIDAIDEEDGGTVRASNGVIGADRIFETDGYWIDTRGRIGPNAVGVTIMAHPSLAHSRCSRGRTALWRSIPSHARAAAWNRARSIARCTASGPTTSRTTWTWHARSRRLPRQQCCNAVTHARTATGPAAGLGEARVPR